MVAPFLAQAVAADAQAKALDLYCGHGNVVSALVTAGADVTGLDLSRAMLDMARASVPEARFVDGDAMELPFAEAAFDAMTIGFEMPHVQDPPRVLAEARRHSRHRSAIAASPSWISRTIPASVAAEARDYLWGDPPSERRRSMASRRLRTSSR